MQTAAELGAMLEAANKEILRLTKVIQKMHSNISKMGLDESNHKCECSNPHPIPNKSSTTGYICLNCAGQ